MGKAKCNNVYYDKPNFFIRSWMTWCCEFVLPWCLKWNGTFPTYSANPIPSPRASFQTTISPPPPPPPPPLRKKKLLHPHASSPNLDYNRHFFLLNSELIWSGKSEFLNNMMPTLCVALASNTNCSISPLNSHPSPNVPTAGLPRPLPLPSPYTHTHTHTQHAHTHTQPNVITTSTVIYPIFS